MFSKTFTVKIPKVSNPCRYCMHKNSSFWNKKWKIFWGWDSPSPDFNLYYSTQAQGPPPKKKNSSHCLGLESSHPLQKTPHCDTDNFYHQISSVAMYTIM